MARLLLNCVVMLGMVAPATGLAAQNPVTPATNVPEIEIDPGLPINLDAESSEFDRLNNRLAFTKVHITQGPLDIQADAGSAARLDFEDTVWTFSGQVEIRHDGMQIWSDTAQATFRNHRLTLARLHGSPARFEQHRPDDGGITRGQARDMEYALDRGLITMSGDAWVSDGANEVSGSHIAYDVVRDRITAEGSNAGKVRVKIIPPADTKP